METIGVVDICANGSLELRVSITQVLVPDETHQRVPPPPRSLEFKRQRNGPRFCSQGSDEMLNEEAMVGIAAESFDSKFVPGPGKSNAQSKTMDTYLCQTVAHRSSS